MLATLRGRREAIGAALGPLDRHMVVVARRSQSPPVERAAAGLSNLGRGGLVWFGLAALIGAGRRPFGRLEATAISTVPIGAAFTGSVGLARLVDRSRSCAGDVEPLVPCPEGGSFPSDQAAAAFAAAEILGWFEPRLRAWLLAIAATVAASRVAAGVHHPSDVVAGGLGGAAIGRAVTMVARRRSGLAA